MFVFICLYPFFSETGEAFLEEYPNNKRDHKTLEELILKRVQLGTKSLEEGWSSYEHFQELGCVDISLYHWDFVNVSENSRKPKDQHPTLSKV